MECAVITDNTKGERVLVVMNGSVVCEVFHRNGATHHGRMLEAQTIADALSTLTPADYEKAYRGQAT